MMTPIKERNVILCVLLTIVTLGIYGIIWFVSMTDDMRKVSGHENLSGGMALLLTLVTCSIYGYFWAWNMGKANKDAKIRHGMMPTSNDSVLYLLLQIFGLGWVNYILIQSDLNKYAQIEVMNFNNKNTSGYQVHYK